MDIYIIYIHSTVSAQHHGIKCRENIAPNASILIINGDRNPHTGQVARMSNSKATIPVAVIVGTTLGQYTSHALESESPLTLGKYSIKYSRRVVLMPTHSATICNRDRLADEDDDRRT